MTKHAIPTECLTRQWTGGPCIVHALEDQNSHPSMVGPSVSFIVLREHLTGKVAVYYHAGAEATPTLADAVVEMETARKMWDSLIKNGYKHSKDRMMGSL